MTLPLDLTYPGVLAHLRRHLHPGRTETRAFLAWFLEHYYRLEETEAQDAICDGPDDKGVDGIYIDTNLERIEILQSKLFQNSSKTVGDGSLRTFGGTVAQFLSVESIDAIAANTGNSELASLIRENKISELVAEGYDVRGVFITNAALDANAEAYLATRNDISVYDASGLRAGYISSDPSDPIATPMTLDVTGYDVIEYRTPEATAFVAPLLASELVKLGGLENGDLFAWNVRQALGRTKVNRAIAESVRVQDEHKNFLLYHNGLTVLCQKIEKKANQVVISGYTVVNGCQSLTTLFDNRLALSNELRVLSRLIQLPPDSDLAAKITRHSNNQNAINARDLQSNSTLQRRLQSEFASVFGGDVGYEIKRGENLDNPLVIGNDEAARMLLAFDLEEPWTCHQTYRLFDELHTDIFARPEVDARHIYAINALCDEVLAATSGIKNQLMGSYRLTRYYLLYLLRQALLTDTIGREFVKRPQDFCKTDEDVGKVRNAARVVLGDLIVDLNAELDDRQASGSPFDYKRELKSPSPVRALTKAIIPMYEKAVVRGRVSSFEDEMTD